MPVSPLTGFTRFRDRRSSPCVVVTVISVLMAYKPVANSTLGEWLVERNKPAESPKQVAAIDVVELYGGVQVSDFGPLALKACRERMVQRGLARRHVNQRVNRIRRCFRWGVENELVAPTVLEGLRSVTALKKGRTPAPETLPVQPVPREHVEAVLPHVAKQVACMIQLQLLTGMRPGEVVQMRPGDIDRSGDVWVYRPIHNKTDYRGIDWMKFPNTPLSKQIEIGSARRIGSAS